MAHFDGRLGIAHNVANVCVCLCLSHMQDTSKDSQDQTSQKAIRRSKRTEIEHFSCPPPCTNGKLNNITPSGFEIVLWLLETLFL